MNHNDQGPYPPQQQIPPQQHGQPQNSQFQNFQQHFGDVVSNQRILAAAACGFGGLLVVAMSILGGSGASEFLDKSGYGWFSLLIYLLVGAFGIAIWREGPYAEYAAGGLVAFEGVIQIIGSYYARGDFPEWMFFLKVLIFAAIVQLIWDLGEDDTEPQQIIQQPPPQQPIPPGAMPRRRKPPGPGY